MKVGDFGFIFSNNKCFRNSLIHLLLVLIIFITLSLVKVGGIFLKMGYGVMVSTIAFGAISLGSNPSVPATND